MQEKDKLKEYYLEKVTELLIKKGIVKTKEEALNKGIIELSNKYLSEDADLERLDWEIITFNSMMQSWDEEPEDTWDDL